MRYIDKGASDKVIKHFAEISSTAVSIAKKLYENKILDKLAKDEVPCNEVYDMIIKKAKHLG